MKSNVGENNTKSVLTDHEVDLLLLMYEKENLPYGKYDRKKLSLEKLAIIFGISKTSVYYICTGHCRYRRG